MNICKKEYVHNLLYSKNKEDIIGEIKNITNSELLHIIASIYNWDNGFEIPYGIINNKNCDLGTALMMFYEADGYRVLENREEQKNSILKEWTNFISEIEGKILNNKFQVNNIKFIPPLTKVQIYKLKNNNIKKIFIEESNGKVIDIANV